MTTANNFFRQTNSCKKEEKRKKEKTNDCSLVLFDSFFVTSSVFPREIIFPGVTVGPALKKLLLLLEVDMLYSLKVAQFS